MSDNDATYDCAEGSTYLDHGDPVMPASFQVGRAYPDDASETLVAMTFYDATGATLTLCLREREARRLGLLLRREADLLAAVEPTR